MELNVKDLKSSSSNKLFPVFYNKILMKMFGKRLEGPLNINKSWQQAGFISNLSAMGHLQMVGSEEDSCKCIFYGV